MGKYGYVLGNTPPSGWRWTVHDDKKKPVESGNAKGEQEAHAMAKVAIAKLEKADEED